MSLKNKLSPGRNLAMELVRVTEAAAIAAARYIGRGDKENGKKAAADAMRAFLRTVNMKGQVVIGEGAKVGTGRGAEVDVAIDPVEGARLLAEGRSNAIAAIAVAERGSMWKPGPSSYMNKIVVERKAGQAIDIRLSPTDNLHRIAEALGRPVSSLTVFMLDKPRHASLIEEIRQAGARISLHSDGDLMGALLAAMPGSAIDVLMGVGGSPEGVLAAAAVKALGGGMQAMRAPQREDEKRRLRAAGVKIREVLTQDELACSDNTSFAATAITPGPLLEGVHFGHDGSVSTHSIVIRSLTGSVRFIKGIHQLERRHPPGGAAGLSPAQASIEIF